jgi:formate dehydrogenase subunit delta
VDVHKLVKMANEIGAFFEAEPDHQVAVEGVAAHLKRFWDPRMRRQILQWVDERDGEGLKDLVLEAIRSRRTTLLPSETPRA